MHEFPDLLPWEEMTAMLKRHEEHITALEKDLGDARDYITGLETTCITMNQQLDALEKVVADLTAALPQPEKVIQSVSRDLFTQAQERLTPEQKKMLSEAQEDDCIF